MFEIIDGQHKIITILSFIEDQIYIRNELSNTTKYLVINELKNKGISEFVTQQDKFPEPKRGLMSA